jgi:hypothetical protein
MRATPPQNAKLQQRHDFSVTVMLETADQYRLPAVRFAGGSLRASSYGRSLGAIAHGATRYD